MNEENEYYQFLQTTCGIYDDNKNKFLNEYASITKLTTTVANDYLRHFPDTVLTRQRVHRLYVPRNATLAQIELMYQHLLLMPDTTDACLVLTKLRKGTNFVDICAAHEWMHPGVLIEQQRRNKNFRTTKREPLLQMLHTYQVLHFKFNNGASLLRLTNEILKQSKCMTDECDNCSATGILLDCARCHLTKYCAKSCQTQHWKAEHKKTCVPMGTRAPYVVKPVSRPCAICHDELVHFTTTKCCHRETHAECLKTAELYNPCCPFCRA